jgi:transposase
MKGDIVEIANPDEILKRIKDEKDPQMRIRLSFLNIMANHGKSYDESTEMLGLSVSTGYVWIRKWNQNGYEGLKDKINKTGRPSKLSKEDLARLKDELSRREYWTTKEVVSLIKGLFGVDLSEDQVIKILRDKLEMNFSKPYPSDYRRPANAEDLLDNQLNLVLSILRSKGIKEDEISIGFIDEARPQNTANTVRVWSFGKARIKKNTTKFAANTIGFYAIKGNSVNDFLVDSKAASIAAFFDRIKESNINYKAIVCIIDNFASHKSKLVKEKAEELGIYLVFLPPYSPDLNPIEFIWKSIKRVLSIKFIMDLDDLKMVITESWNNFSKSKSYAKNWTLRFLSKNIHYKSLCV